jgi:hypothetical protein
VSQRRMMKINSIGVLEKISGGGAVMMPNNYLARQIEQNNSDPFTIECQDWGACYYKFFFNNHEHANYLGKSFISLKIYKLNTKISDPI